MPVAASRCKVRRGRFWPPIGCSRFKYPTGQWEAAECGKSLKIAASDWLAYLNFTYGSDHVLSRCKSRQKAPPTRTCASEVGKSESISAETLSDLARGLKWYISESLAKADSLK
ncbi:hypothetical protein TEQG_01715 [Trichophyton equinum CBS 127.97]|uniref:Uncharacterized protein n=1 Tax=Trichophyton equinum (strain ATCC MYA-4606 / CBS 127.97) TaxID=559882 RepID=F2PL82_TRIEC|nr:hypothetical protein TEQG_01715 [Trichophyton equinum CBS 127.97]